LSERRRQLAWDRAAPAPSLSNSLRVVQGEDMLLHIALHIARHNFERGLRSFVDLLLTIERWGSSWRWDDLVSDYRAERVEVPMYVSLRRTRDLLGARIPDSVFEQIPEPAGWAELAPLVTHMVLAPPAQQLPVLARRLAEQPTALGRIKQLARRMSVYYWPPDRAPDRTVLSAAGDVLRRLAFDVRVKPRKYWAAWWRGALRAQSRSQAVALAQAGGSIARLLAAAEATAPTKDSSRRVG
jgi:hypothetical protein